MKFSSVLTPTVPASLYADGYDGDVIRLRVKPDTEWVWEVPEVITAHPVADSDVVVTVSEGGRHIIKSGGSTLTVWQEKDELRFAFATEGHGAETHGKVELRNVEAPAVEMRFPQAKHLYGVPEHTQNLAMKKGESYQLFNTDAFEYPLHSGEPKYGCIPFLMAYAAAGTCGVLFLNSSEMLMRVLDQPGELTVRWTAEVGIADLFFIPGPTPSAVQRHHANLTGHTFFPPYAMLGYHQCRWNYMTQDECVSVETGMSGADMPYDVLWLDIEYSAAKKYFQFDHVAFPDPKALLSYLVSRGRKLVTIKDPHTKTEAGWEVYDEGVAGNHFVRTPDDSKNFEGDCWPGNSCWPDFLQRRTREWYASFFHDDRCECGGRDVYTWVDMNEPAVFHGYRERTMIKEALHHTDEGRPVQHRYLHNIYGFLSVLSAAQGCLEAAGPGKEPERPFILTRSFFAGSQRLCGMWAGDNMARWDHLQATMPELLGLSLSNYPFCGADAGGFLREPTSELFQRWFQAAVFYPFFRGHANMDTRRREPYAWEPAARHRIRAALYLRYTLIPYLYTVLYHAHVHGDTVLRPLFFEFPLEEALAETQDTFMFGPALLACPVTHTEAKTVAVRLPTSAVWYAYPDGGRATAEAAGLHTVPVTLDSIPMYLRGGRVLATKAQKRASTAFATHDPFTLHVALDEHGTSTGDLYLDDGRTFQYKTGAFAHRLFTYSAGRLTCRSVAAKSRFAAPNTVERVVIYGAPATLKTAVANEVTLAVKQHGETVVIDTRAVPLRIDEDWCIDLE
ncbi:alpha glucosidase II subunit [Novymonas esmeraldas]|uniref:Glucosidase II subunit alpha n=1 Tax=Novymonas esmeraldas TaxID=1808958 RepID=A0AAW0EUX3_9TRYP